VQQLNLKRKKMKKLISTLVLVTLFTFCSLQSMAFLPIQSNDSTGTISVWTSSELLPLTNLLVDEYVKSHPQVDFVISTGDGLILAEKISSTGNLGMVKKESANQPAWNGLWKMTIGRDIVVPVVNERNPYLSEITLKGISKKGFLRALENPTTATWSEVLGIEQGKTSSCRIYGSPMVTGALADFLQANPDQLTLLETTDAADLFKKLQADEYAIGFCKLADMMGDEGTEKMNGLAFAPIDVNGNQQVDYFEQIYSNADYIARGIWIGKYPKALYENVYCVANTLPVDKNQTDFLEWVLTDGQQFLLSSGISELVSNERLSKVSQLEAVDYAVVESEDTGYTTTTWWLLGIVVVAGLLFLFNLIGIFRNDHASVTQTDEPEASAYFSEQSIKAPGGMFFDKSHTWAFMEKSGFVRVGVDDFLQHVTGTVTKVKMKLPGEKIRKGEVFLTLIQNGKQLDIYSPVSGIIMENNASLAADACLINQSPFSEGWVYVMESDNWLREIKSLVMQEPYLKWIQKEFVRLKDFLSFHLSSESSFGQQYVMQEGGELKDHLLEDFGPKVWEEFQTSFINNAC